MRQCPAPKARAGRMIAAEVFLPRLIFCLKDRDPEVRRKAIWSLGELGFGAKKAMPLLVDALNSEDAVIRHRAARILGGFGQFARVATSALRRTVLLDEDLQVSQTARKALEEISG